MLRNSESYRCHQSDHKYNNCFCLDDISVSPCRPQHLEHYHTEHRCPTRLCAQPAALHAADPRLHCQVQLQPHHQVRWWHNSGRSHHPPLTIDSSTVERVSSTKFLGVHITEDLTWTTNTMSLSKKAQQRLHFLRRLKRASLPPPILTTFYRGTIESVLTSCITVWYGNCSAADRKTLQRTVNTAAKIIGTPLPSILDILLARCSSKTNSIMKDPTHPFHSLFQLLPSGRRYRSIRARSARLLNSFFPQAVRALKSNHPAPPLKPHANPYLLKHGPSLPQTNPPSPNTPQPYHTKEKKNCMKLFLCNLKCATHRWVGLY